MVTIDSTVTRLPKFYMRRRLTGNEPFNYDVIPLDNAFK